MRGWSVRFARSDIKSVTIRRSILLKCSLLVASAFVAAGAQAAQEPNELPSNVIAPPSPAPAATSEPVAVAATPPAPAPAPSDAPGLARLRWRRRHERGSGELRQELVARRIRRRRRLARSDHADQGPSPALSRRADDRQHPEACDRAWTVFDERRERRRVQLVRRSDAVDVEAVEHHHLGPRLDEVLRKLLFAVLRSVDLRDRAELGVRSEDEVHGGCRPL